MKNKSRWKILQRNFQTHLIDLLWSKIKEKVVNNQKGKVKENLFSKVLWEGQNPNN